MKDCFSVVAPLAILFMMAGCSQADTDVPHNYLFMGHTYDWNQGNRIDPRLEKVDYARFDQIWLGGDICSRTTEDPATLDYLDSIFDLDNPGTQWALGNHDLLFGGQERIEAHTGRPTFYSTWVNGICLLVLNTNYFWYYPSEPAQENCPVKAEQAALIRAVCDTIDKASHLVILHHHALFAGLTTGRDGQPVKAFNANFPDPAMTCDSSSRFTELVYPMLKAVQDKGVQVILVGGDLGTKAKQFVYRTADGIVLLGAGLNNSLDPRYAPEYVTSFDPDKVLVFHHYPKSRTLDFEFSPPDQLPQK